jgi:hypothetical protein
MATPDPEVEEILATLGETPLAWMAIIGRSAVDALPDLDERASGGDLEAANMQLAAIEEALLDPLRREITATKTIGELAEGLGLSDQVEVLVEDGGEPNRLVLNGEGRIEALETFAGALDRALGQARERAFVRRRRDQ